MKSYFLTIVIFYVVTQFCATALEKNDEDNLVTNYHSRQYNSENPTQPKDTIRARDEYSKNKGLVRFKDDSPTPPNEPHFFPIESDNPDYEETHGSDVNLKKHIREKPYSNDEQSDDIDYNLEDIEDEAENYKNIKNKETANTEATEASGAFKTNINGRVVFEDNIKTGNPEPVGNKRRKSRQNKGPISLKAPYNSFNYPGYIHPGRRPGYSLYQPGSDGTYQGYGFYPGYQMIGPLKNGQNDQTDQFNTKYTDQYLGGASGGQASSGTPGYLQNTGYPANGKYGYAPYPNSQYSQYINNPGYQGYPGPQRRPKSLTQQAVSAVAEALTSIALFDDKQCVPRILCEVASGSSAGSPTLLKATAGLGPLLSILQSYNSVSSSPLFLFGRAAVLGMTSIGNTVTCHRAYPQCPRDPTELVNYLNNHNGGFFRFFGQPGPQKQQNLEQFYNYLAGQSGAQPPPQQQNYAYNYGYNTHNQYPKNNNLNNYHRGDKVINSKETDIDIDNIQERIQNKPSIDIDDEENAEEGSKWTFPDAANDRSRRPRKQKFPTDVEEIVRLGERDGSQLKFPDERGPTDDIERDKRRDFIRTQKVKFIPNRNVLNFETNTAVNKLNLQEYEFDYKHNFYVKKPKQNSYFTNKDEGQLVYIVRGNGDPNYPEIVKVKPGQRP